MQNGYQLDLSEINSSFVMAGFNIRTLRDGDLNKVKNILKNKLTARFRINNRLKQTTINVIERSDTAEKLYQGLFNAHWASTTKTFVNGKRIY